jgi:hypothetical protein
MAIYKVIQDIEAEDHILGPLSLRQFIYALISVFLLYICFIALTKHIDFLLIPFLPPAIFTGFFAFPFGKDQPTEVWALAKVRFLFKPRRRIWDQSGIKELVTITVPKKIERVLTNGLSPNEVQSRLQALANTIDSRGWAIKNVNVNLYTQAGSFTDDSNSDRLINMSSVPQQVPDVDIQASDDILDETNNPIAHQFDQMITASDKAHRQSIINQMNSIDTTPQPVPQQQPPAGPGASLLQVSDQPTAPANYWFLNQTQPPAEMAPDQAMFADAPVVQPGLVDTSAVPASDELSPTDEAALAAELKHRSIPLQTNNYSHLRTIQPLNAQRPAQAVNVPLPVAKTDADLATAAVTARADAAILSLANNNDLNVATLAREAQKAKNPEESPPDDEVIISLH